MFNRNEAYDAQKEAEARSLFYDVNWYGKLDDLKQLYKNGGVLRWALYKNRDIIIWDMNDQTHTETNARECRKHIARGFFSNSEGNRISDFEDIDSPIERNAIGLAIRKILI